MSQRSLALLLLLLSTTTYAQQSPITQPLPPTTQLLLDAERNQLAAEAANKDYTYHVHLEQQELDHSGNPKKTTTTDSESLTIDGIRVDRVVARNGRPLTDKEAQKESDRIDKQVANAKVRREQRAAEGKPTDALGYDFLTVFRIL